MFTSVLKDTLFQFSEVNCMSFIKIGCMLNPIPTSLSMSLYTTKYIQMDVPGKPGDKLFLLLFYS